MRFEDLEGEVQEGGIKQFLIVPVSLANLVSFKVQYEYHTIA